MTAPEDEGTRPISVAELLAKNGTIGSPPVGGRRRRRRGNADAVTVAELTGEIPVVRTGEMPVVDDDATIPVVDDDGAATPVDTAPEATEIAVEVPADTPAEAPLETPAETPVETPAEPPTVSAEAESDAEQMTFDPVDESPVLLAEAVKDDDVAELQSYLRSSGGTLFGGQTVADDRARRGIVDDEDEGHGAAAVAPDTEAADETDTTAGTTTKRPRGGKAAALGRGVLAVLQSILAVAFGAGLFVAFDQLWRWNNIVALVLSVLVILGLVVAVRVVRKTEDITSTLIAVAVGALVTLGPLALLQSI